MPLPENAGRTAQDGYACGESGAVGFQGRGRFGVVIEDRGRFSQC
jgi:hypothetical protein